MMKMKLSDIKLRREKLLARQKGICPLCGTLILKSEAALDHCHATGHTRAVLHKSCNGSEGRILTYAGRMSRGDDPSEFLRRLLRYWNKDFTNNPIHPLHGRKRRRRRKCKSKR